MDVGGARRTLRARGGGSRPAGTPGVRFCDFVTGGTERAAGPEGNGLVDLTHVFRCGAQVRFKPAAWGARTARSATS